MVVWFYSRPLEEALDSESCHTFCSFIFLALLFNLQLALSTFKFLHHARSLLEIEAWLEVMLIVNLIY